MSEKEVEQDAKLIIENNIFLQYALKIMNGIKLSDEEVTPNYEELYNNVALLERKEMKETTSEELAFYFNLISTGYDSFGLEFLVKMINYNGEVMVNAIKAFMDGLTNNAKENMEKGQPEKDIPEEFPEEIIPEVPVEDIPEEVNN